MQNRYNSKDKIQLPSRAPSRAHGMSMNNASIPWSLMPVLRTVHDALSASGIAEIQPAIGFAQYNSHRGYTVISSVYIGQMEYHCIRSDMEFLRLVTAVKCQDTYTHLQLQQDIRYVAVCGTIVLHVFAAQRALWRDHGALLYALVSAWCIPFCRILALCLLF